MATYVIYGYAASALVYNSGTGAFDLRSDFDPTRDRIKVTITDDDASFDGDDADPADNDIGSDGNQTAVVTTPDGTQIASGLVYSDMYAEITKPDTSIAYLDRIEIGGVHLGYFTDTLLVPGESYPVSFSNETTPGSETTYSSFQSVPCYCSGTMIETQTGLMPVDWISTSDCVLTKDHGYQQVLWVGRTAVPLSILECSPQLWPVTLHAGALEHGLPRYDLRVSPDHRILMGGPQIELLFGAQDVFVPAKALVNGSTVTTEAPETSVTFFHILIETHQILRAEGTWAESFFTGEEAMKRVGGKNARLISQSLQGKPKDMSAARMCLTVKEAALVRDMLPAYVNAPLAGLA